ncbi:hypothetical protein BRADI_5g10539v3 [Brachypodium distachyon]|uniref:Uncharacterized protein n=1 Tax=Brachypodium distachyon TaxID=15368 RepID=A0A0Q3E8M7_BRADI|nr:hypothetical protein BRADI_5g10539v3 [Brachypodium distachyon]
MGYMARYFWYVRTHVGPFLPSTRSLYRIYVDCHRFSSPSLHGRSVQRKEISTAASLPLLIPIWIASLLSPHIPIWIAAATSPPAAGAMAHPLVPSYYRIPLFRCNLAGPEDQPRLLNPPPPSTSQDQLRPPCPAASLSRPRPPYPPPPHPRTLPKLSPAAPPAAATFSCRTARLL